MPEVVRQARAIFTSMTRSQLLHHVGLRPYCQQVAHRCLVWKNNLLISQGHQQLIVNKVKGNAVNLQTWDFWINAARQRHVIAFLAGPPCETWSCARAVDTATSADHHQPRVIRALEHLWGLPCVRIMELLQLYTGNTLLGFALVIFMEICLIDGYAILEHPAESMWDPTAASIWKLPIVCAILALSNVQKIRFSQGLLGAYAPIPGIS